MSTSPTTIHQQSIMETKVDGPSFISSNPFTLSNMISSPSSQANLDTSLKMYTNIENSSVLPQNQHQMATNYQHQMSILTTKQYHHMDTVVLDNELDVKGNGHYQKLVTNKFNNDSSIDYELLSKFNRMHTQSPQLPRKNYATLRNLNNSPPSYMPQGSPLLQQKLMMKTDENLHYNSYKPPAQMSTYSPVVKKRYGTDGVMVAEDLEFRILHGNTSPIVLQRFYHQQNQLRDQKIEEQMRAMKDNAPSTNPFEHHAQSNIPLANNSYSRYQSSPTPQRHNFYELNYMNNTSPQNSYVPQHSRNTNGNSMIPSYRHHVNQMDVQHMKHENLALRPPSSPQLDRLRVNLEKPNFYERHQLLPVEVQLKDNNTLTSTQNPPTIENNKSNKGT